MSNGAEKSVDRYYFIALPLRLIEKLAFRPYGRAGDERNIMPSLR